MRKNYFRIYHALPYESEVDEYLGKISVFLADQPGLLATLASIFAKYALNITYFYYNRSEHPNRVLLEVKGYEENILQKVRQKLLDLRLFDGDLQGPTMQLSVFDTHSILKLEVQLSHRSGALGEFAGLLRDHNANVIYMSYNEDMSDTSANVSLTTSHAQEVDLLLKDINERGYYYSLIYKGAEQKEVEDIIGLNLVERFFFRLKKILNTDDIEYLKKLVESSQRLSDTLINFSKEAGKHLEAGQIFTNVLTLASVSLSRTGPKFSYRQLPSLSIGRVTLNTFRIPTGGNILILEGEEEAVMIDGGYGHYYNDVKRMLIENGIDPARIKRIYLGHCDADHAGMSGYFAEEYGSQVFLHGDAKGILKHENRAWGSASPLLDLNHYFTMVINEFTKFHVPENWIEYGNNEIAHEGGFRVIDKFALSGQTYEVLEGGAGHVPGQVFFMSDDSGLVFTGDFLLTVESLSTEDRENLNLPKFMMTSTNVDSLLFRQEMTRLKRLIHDFDQRLRDKKGRAIIVPGHGDYYPAAKLTY